MARRPAARSHGVGDAFQPHLRELRETIDRGLSHEAERLAAGRLGRGAAFALGTPGKRLRPIAAILAGEMLGATPSRVLPFAMAVELVHTASLILDDLPVMDDAETRRGEPALHRRVGDADAILTAFALLSRGFALAADVPQLGRREQSLPAELVRILETAVGFSGMCEGQSLDLVLGETEKPRLRELEEVHRLKTGALFAAALEGGARLGGADGSEIDALLTFGKNLGLAFQVADDLLDVRGDPDRLGKPVGKDHGRRVTFVTLFAASAAEEILHELHDAARAALAPLGKKADPLRRFADLLEARDA